MPQVLWTLSSPITDGTQALSSETTKSWPPNHQGIPMLILVLPELFLSQSACSSSSCQPLQNIWKLPRLSQRSAPTVSQSCLQVVSEYCNVKCNMTLWGPSVSYLNKSPYSAIFSPFTLYITVFFCFGRLFGLKRKRGGGPLPFVAEIWKAKCYAGYC